MNEPTKPIACQGGFCHQRESCQAHYAKAGAIEEIAVRICSPGHERPIRFVEVLRVQDKPA